jgi:hypothetical protein
MQFRWTVVVALWTILSGPVFAPSCPAPSQTKITPAGSAHSAPVRSPAR